MGPRCLAQFEISSRQHQRSIRVGARLEPKFRRVVGEGFRVTREQFVVTRRRPVPPFAALLESVDLVQDTGQLRRVIGIVGGDRQRE